MQRAHHGGGRHGRIFGVRALIAGRNGRRFAVAPSRRGRKARPLNAQPSSRPLRTPALPPRLRSVNPRREACRCRSSGDPQRGSAERPVAARARPTGRARATGREARSCIRQARLWADFRSVLNADACRPSAASNDPGADSSTTGSTRSCQILRSSRLREERWRQTRANLQFSRNCVVIQFVRHVG